MTREEVTTKLFEQLQPHLPGFKPQKKEESLARRITGGTQFIGLALIDHRPLFKFSLPVSIRIEEVEEIINRFAGSPPKYHRLTRTTGTLLSYFYGESDKKEFKIQSPEDIEAAIAGVAPVIRDRIIPFLDSHQSVQSLDAVMNGPEGARFDRTNPPYRQMHGLILARLAGNPRFDALAEAALVEARGWQPHDGKKLEALVAHLRTL
jgi:hypothetical protein